MPYLVRPSFLLRRPPGLLAFFRTLEVSSQMPAACQRCRKFSMPLAIVACFAPMGVLYPWHLSTSPAFAESTPGSRSVCSEVRVPGLCLPDWYHQDHLCTFCCTLDRHLPIRQHGRNAYPSILAHDIVNASTYQASGSGFQFTNFLTWAFNLSANRSTCAWPHVHLSCANTSSLRCQLLMSAYICDCESAIPGFMAQGWSNVHFIDWFPVN